MAGAKYFPPAVRETFSRRKPGQRDFPPTRISSLARRKPLGENDARRDGIFIFKASLALFFLFIFASLSFRTIEHTWLLPNTQLVDSLPSNGLCLSDHRVYSARGTIKRSRTKRCEVEIRRRGNYQAHRCFVFDGTTEFHGGEGDCFH